VVDWLADMNYYDMPVTEHPLREGVRDNTNHYVTGRDGGRDIDLRRFALEGMAAVRPAERPRRRQLQFRPTCASTSTAADRTYNGINASIDKLHRRAGHRRAPALRVHAGVAPAEERTRLDLAGRRHHQHRLVHRLLGPTSPGSMRRCSTAAATRSTCAA
jgi:putative flavoprotein involved in K+ transport